MRITNKKIIQALKDGDYVTSNKFEKYCYLRLRDGDLELIDWGQVMNCQEFVYKNFISLMEDGGLYICDDKGNKFNNN